MAFSLRTIAGIVVLIAAIALAQDEGCDVDEAPLKFVEPHYDFKGERKPGIVGQCVVSPDGEHVYVGRHMQHRLLVYEHDPGTGGLFLIQDVECDMPAGLVVSPDGKHLYVRGGKGNAAAQVYLRDPATGKLTKLIEYSIDEFRGVRGILDFAISSNGLYLYGVGEFGLLVFARKAESGAIEVIQAFQDDNAADLIEGTEQRYAQAIENATIVDGLRMVEALTIAPDGATIYTAARDAVGIFQRDLESGRLEFVDAVKEPPNIRTYELSIPTDVGIAPDGRHVYVTCMGGNVVVFERNGARGELKWIEQLQNEKNGVRGLRKAYSMAVSPTGHDVFVASYGEEGAIARFSRDPKSGRLSFVGAVVDGEGDCVTLGGSYRVAVSPDGRHLYNCSVEHTVGVFAIPEIEDEAAK